MKYTLIIPTMWFHPEMLSHMVETYYQPNSLIAEILLFDNNFDARMDALLIHDKIRIIGTGENQFVNPAWIQGIDEAKSKKVILLNDDIIISDFGTVLLRIDRVLKKGMVIGLSEHCFKQKGLHIGRIGVRKASIHMTYGFGVMIAMFRESFIDIPSELKVWFGDNLQFKYNKAYLINGFEVRTPMQGTSRKIDLRGVNKRELKFYKDNIQ